MSSPPNALDAYRTYSYHHILIAADGTDTAEALIKDSEITRYDHPDVKFCPRPMPNAGNYIVLINGLTDAQFVIQSAKWSTVPIPTTSATTPSVVTSVQTMAVDGELEILEPQGVNFFNVLANATRMLHVDPALITFVLKTIFVGHRDDGITNMITTIRPLMFMMVDIAANIEVSGATYQMSLVGIVNGAAKLPHVNSIVSGLTFNVQKTLGKSFDLLEEKIKTTYAGMYSVLTKEGGNCGVTLNKDEFSEVEYNFKLDPHYEEFDAGDHKDAKFKDLTDKGGYVSNLGDMASIESIISGIMMTSTKVVEEAKGKLPNERFMFKISSDIKTNPKTGKFAVTYYIHRYQAVVVAAEDFQTFEPKENTGITFDYIFTGKNIDILDMDIKMEYGLMFFQVMAAEGTSPTSSLHLLNHYNPDTFVKGSGSAKVLADDGRPVSICQQNASTGKILRPLFLGTSLNHPMFRDTSSIGASASFNSMLTRHAAVESLGVKVTIRGNPQLLSETTQIPSDVSISTLTAKYPEVIVPPDADADLVAHLRNIMPTIHKTPAYVKIKVWSPKSWTGSSEGEVAANYEGDYSQNLWYNGWYYMIQIDNIFDGGTFTQELELLSLPTELSETDANEECYKQFLNDVYEAKQKAGQGEKAVKPADVEVANSNVNTGTPAVSGEDSNVNIVKTASTDAIPKMTASATEKLRGEEVDKQSDPGKAKVYNTNVENQS